jgi:cytochrome c-type biogenesis protein
LPPPVCFREAEPDLELTEVTFIAYFWAFVAGLVSFLSPCVLPLFPGYLSYVSGVSIDELGTRSRKVGLASLAFVIGFVALYSVQGAIAGGFGESMGDFVRAGSPAKHLLEVIGGVILIAFGLFSLGIFHPPAWLERERRVRMLKRPASFAGIVVAGMVFSLGIGPCTAPFLISVATLAADTQDPLGGASLLFVYGLGMGLPFIISGLLFAKTLGTFSFVKRHFGTLKIISGTLLIVFGFLMATGRLELLTSWLSNWMPNVLI